MTDWRPIETAPTNGTPVLLFLDPPLDTNSACGYAPVSDLEVVVGWAEDKWRGGHEWMCGFVEEGTADTEGYSIPISMRVQPTHWMPLPEKPHK